MTGPEFVRFAATVGATESCETAVEQLIELQRNASRFLSRDGAVAAEELFSRNKTRGW